MCVDGGMLQELICYPLCVRMELYYLQAPRVQEKKKKPRGLHKYLIPSALCFQTLIWQYHFYFFLGKITLWGINYF